MASRPKLARKWRSRVVSGKVPPSNNEMYADLIMKVLGLIGLGLLFYVPGWATWLVFHRKHLYSEDSTSTIRNLFCQVAAGAVMDGVLALFLALAGIFNLWIIAGAAAAWTVAVLVVVRPRFSRKSFGIATSGRELRQAAPLIVCLLVGFFLFMLPFMSVLGSADEGLYPNIAGTIARTGSPYIKDPVVPTVKPEASSLFYRQILRKDGTKVAYSYTIEEAGLYISNFTTGKITPQFFYYYPAMMAMFMGMIGFRGGFFILTFFALMSVWAIYLLAREFMESWASFVAALFLAVNFLEVYFAKFSTAEIATQFFFLVGIYAFIRMRKQDDAPGVGLPWWQFLAGIGFGAMLLAREDSALLFAPLFLVYCLYFARDGIKSITRDRIFLLLVLGFTIFLGALCLGPYRIYVRSTVSASIHIIPGGYLSIGLAAAVLIGLAVVLRRWQSAYRYLLAHKKPILGITCVVLLLAFVYLMFVKPAMLPANSQDKLLTLKYFGFYLTWLGVILMVVGYLAFIYLAVDRRNVLLPLAGLTYTGIFAYNPMVALVFVWWMRRLVPVALPVGVLMMAYGLYRGWVAIKARWVWSRVRMNVVRIGIACVVLALVGLCVSSSVKIAWIKGSSETLPMARTISDIAAEPGQIVCEALTGAIMGAPLRSFYGRRVVTLYQPVNMGNPLFLDFLATNQRQGRQNYLLLARESVPLLLPLAAKSLNVQFAGRVAANLSAVPQTPKPEYRVANWNVVLDLYKISPKVAPAASPPQKPQS